jgi:hypothetical protein
MRPYAFIVSLAAALMAPGAASACVSHVQHQGIAVELTCASFAAGRHRLGYRDGILYEIDGYRYAGTGGTAPAFEIESLRVVVDGVAFPVPRALFRTLYDPHVPPQHQSSLSIQRSGELVLFRFRGGHGAAAYEAMWVLNTASHELTRLLYENPEPGKARVAHARLASKPASGARNTLNPGR